ncbi:sensor histidine kinase [Pseudomonas sp.]|uniref:sensor histidine kinase n=1 Tax=Pseudomonas sp. TaxID=306 RepID=UPI003C719427
MAAVQTSPVASTVTRSNAYVLVADDNGDLRNFLVSLLAPHYEVQAVADGREALAAVQQRKPDLLLNDVMMPNLDGLGLLRALREDPETATLPVILLSARTGQEASLEGLCAGADKLFTSQELLARARTHLNMAQARNELNAELMRANEELQAFSYSVSHDLRAPLLAVDGFSEIFQEHCAAQLDDKGRSYLDKIRSSAQRMGELIDDLLQLSRVANADLERNPVDLSSLAQAVGEELQRRNPASGVSLVSQEGLSATADSRMLRILFENLLGNAWKFTGKAATPMISVGTAR